MVGNKKGIIFYGIKDFPSRGGTSRVAENIIKNLANDYKITLCCYRDKNAENNIPGIRVIQFPVLPFNALGVFLYYFISAIHLLLFLNRENIVHAHKTDCALFVPLLRLKFKVIITSHEAPYKRDKWGKVGKFYFKLMERIFMYSGATLTSISEPLSEYYRERYKKQVIFIPNGININQEYDDKRAEAILKQNNISGPYISFAARRLMATKGCHTLLEALHRLNYKHPVVIAGELDHAGDYLTSLKSRYRHLNLHFVGYVQPLPVLLSLIRKSELFVFPSETEGMSIMFLEVISSGANIVASDIPENTQVLNRNEILYFMNKDAQDLAEKIRFALENQEVMAEYNRKAFSKVENSFTWNRISHQYRNLYNSVMQS